MDDAATQPPLRIAIEGLQDDREYYRFAAVGGLTGGRPLTGEWSQFVLQIDDLPSEPQPWLPLGAPLQSRSLMLLVAAPLLKGTEL